MTDRIDVMGTGVVQVPPDALQVQLGAEAVSTDVAVALETARRAAEAMAAAARAGGVRDGDVRTTEIALHSHREHMNDPEAVRAWLGVGVLLRDLGPAGEVLAAVVAAGGPAARVQTASLVVTDPATALAGAREAAFADARRQAEQLAALAGRGLGVVRRVSSVPGGPAPRGGAVEPMAARTALPVEAGTTAVTATVRVRFELR